MSSLTHPSANRSLHVNLGAVLAVVTLSSVGYIAYFLRNYFSLQSSPNYKEFEIEGRSLDLLQEEYDARNGDTVYNVCSTGPVVASKRIVVSDDAAPFRIRVINLDGALFYQKEFLKKYKPSIIDLSHFGPSLRLDCTFALIWEYERAITEAVGSPNDDDWLHERPMITFYGSNDFHHLSLPLIRRFQQPFNLVLFDNHPDWFKYYPGLHCGCWFNHATSLPTVKQAFHFGGASLEFEEYWGFHPWDKIKSGKIAVFPTENTWEGLEWDKGAPQTAMKKSWRFMPEKRVRYNLLELLAPYASILKKYPLYITLDKDCMLRSENIQNWNSGCLTRLETLSILKVLIELSGGRLIGMDVTGDFSPVVTKGIYRAYLHETQHEPHYSNVAPERAAVNNQLTNIEIMKTVEEAIEQGKRNFQTT